MSDKKWRLFITTLCMCKLGIYKLFVKTGPKIGVYRSATLRNIFGKNWICVAYLLIFPSFPDNFGTCGEWETNFDGSQVEIFDSVLLPADTWAGSVKEYSVLVDDVNNGSDLVRLGTILKDDDTADFDESFERLKKER